MNEVKEAIKSIENEIRESENQIALLQQFESGQMEFTEENYHKLCETSLRGSRLLGKEFEKIFSFLTLSDKKHFINDYTFTLEINAHYYEVTIPCSATKNIMIFIPPAETSLIRESTIRESTLQSVEKKLELVEKTLNAKTIFQRANSTMIGYPKPFRVLAYFIKYQTKKNCIERWNDIKQDLLKNKESYEKKIEKDKIIQRDYDATLKYFKDNFVPKFLEWTEQVIIKSSENHFCGEYINK